VRSRNNIRPPAFKAWFGSVASNTPEAPQPLFGVTAAKFFVGGAMNTEKFDGEGWRTLRVLMLSLNGISY